MKCKKILIMVALLCAIFTSGCGMTKKTYQMTEKSKPEVTHSTESMLCTIEVLDKYTLEGMTYYKIKTTPEIYDIFDLSEETYNNLIGAGNDAFKTEEYNLELSLDVLKCEDTSKWRNWFKKSLIDEIRDVELPTGFMDVGDIWAGKDQDDANEEVSNILGTKNMSNSYYKKAFPNNHAYISFEHPDDEDVVRVSIILTRYSIFNEEDFTEEEIKMYTEKIRKIGLDFLDKYAEYIEE